MAAVEHLRFMECAEAGLPSYAPLDIQGVVCVMCHVVHFHCFPLGFCEFCNTFQDVFRMPGNRVSFLNLPDSSLPGS